VQRCGLASKCTGAGESFTQNAAILACHECKIHCDGNQARSQVLRFGEKKTFLWGKIFVFTMYLSGHNTIWGRAQNILDRTAPE